MATRPKTTRLADDTANDRPQTTSAGDAPADTYDPRERASSITPDKGAAAAAGHGVINAVRPVASLPDNTPTGSRTETYKRIAPDGTEKTVSHNYDTGETTVT